MIQRRGKTFALSCASFILGTILACAGGMKGMVTSIDDKGMATVRTEDGKEHKVKGEGWQVGAQVECEQKEGTTSCKAAKM
jgi:hypothetical protein